jgi:hypothetical protein
MIIDHGKVVYAEKEPGKDVTVCSREEGTGVMFGKVANIGFSGFWRRGRLGRTMIFKKQLESSGTGRR